MDNPGYVALTRQSGLLQEMQLVANNIANANTTGYRREASGFSEYVSQAGGDQASLSMARHNMRNPDLAQGALSNTGGRYDVAIEGDGFFAVQGPNGIQLTRAGAFSVNSSSELTTSDGRTVLDSGEAPVFVPADATDFQISADGTISADGQAIGHIGVFLPIGDRPLIRTSHASFTSNEIEPVGDAQMVQGFVEMSNVNPVYEITRMIEVQRAYELGQKLLDQEDERIRNVVQTLTK
jgi:flagellar basal-body rod protein FlgF